MGCHANALRGIALTGLITFLVGCYTVRLREGKVQDTTFQRHAHLFAFGLIGSSRVDISHDCPNGVASSADRLTARDLALTLLSIGIYTPRTVEFRCVGAGDR